MAGDWRGRSEDVNGLVVYSTSTLPLSSDHHQTGGWESRYLVLGRKHATLRAGIPGHREQWEERTPLPATFATPAQHSRKVLMTSPPQPWLQLRVSKHHTHPQVSNLE
jgi:hypothetical protein